MATKSSECREQAAIAVKLLTQEGSTKNAAQQSIVYTLILAWQEKLLPQIDLTKAYRSKSQTEAQKRNDTLLHHLFSVTTLETDAKTERQFYKPRENLGFNVAVLKTRINRSLAVVAHLIQAAQRMGGVDKVVTQNKDHTLSVSGEAYYSEKDRENAPNLSQNWIALTGKAQEGHGQFSKLMRVADAELGFARRQTRARREVDIGEVGVGDIAKALTSKLASREDDEPLSRFERAELEALQAAIEATLATAPKPRRGPKPGTKRAAKSPGNGRRRTGPRAPQGGPSPVYA